jgi:hypothetical protein
MRDAGVSSEGSGFPAVSLHFVVQTVEAVDQTMATPWRRAASW